MEDFARLQEALMELKGEKYASDERASRLETGQKKKKILPFPAQKIKRKKERRKKEEEEITHNIPPPLFFFFPPHHQKSLGRCASSWRWRRRS